ncbi:AsmA family protein, partial [Myxococcus sp. AM010]|nr:AsmA family protein [Myxococcus sp. AM010]
RVPDQLSKEAGGAMKLNAKVTGAAASGGALRFDAKADLNGVDMRPGLLVNKAPGQRLEVAAAGTYAPAKTGSGMTVNVTSMSLGALEDTVTGTATVALAGTGKKATTTFKADVKAAKLDAEKLLMSEEQVLARTGGKPPPEPPPG